MISLSEAQIMAWLVPVLWPFIRVLALFSSMPVLGQRNVPIRVRIALAFFIAIGVAGTAAPTAAANVPLDSPAAILLVVGILVSIFQAATSINEATLTFVPKLLAAVAVLGVAGPWMLTSLVEFVQRTLQSIPGAVG